LYVVLSVLVVLILFTLLVIVLEAFNVGGFDLETTTINILATSILAEAVGLVGIAFKWLFGDSTNSRIDIEI